MIKNDTPYTVPNVPVTMTVEAPASWGKLDGTVTGLGYCDTDPAPLADANVLVEGADGYTANLVTNGNGFYSQWLNGIHSPLTVTVTAPEHSSGLVTGVMVSAGMTTTQNFNLRWLEPCVSTNPTSSK